SWTIVMAGGGTGGHVMPLLAVARELRSRGRRAVFVGTRQGLEARLVPAEGFPIEWIEAGALKNVSAARRLRSLWQLPAGTMRCVSLLGRLRTRVVFSLGGFVAGPVVLAAWLRRIPCVAMEPNAWPGFTNRVMASFVRRALVAFDETRRFFPRAEVTGSPVREEFFQLPAKPRSGTVHVLVTGGSQGSRTLNRAARECAELPRDAPFAARIRLQSGASETIASSPALTVTPFIDDMPAAFGEADLVVSRAGAITVAELAAAGKPSILVPFPFAADDHQTRNAEVLVKAGAARMVRDAEMTGERLCSEIASLAGEPGLLEKMAMAARGLSRPGAARRACEVLEEVAWEAR
ncbi:MAG: undecaprenyldiphospho-muramoylpentapeptide beta-N-acetylglucosaminyltransferase, partial [Bryobacteraceae bacterium]